MILEATGASDPALARIDIKKFSRYNDDLMFEGLLEKGHTILQITAKVGQITPAIKSTLGWVVHANAQCTQSIDHGVSFAAKDTLDRSGFRITVRTVDQFNGRPLHGPCTAAIQEAAKVH